MRILLLTTMLGLWTALAILAPCPACAQSDANLARAELLNVEAQAAFDRGDFAAALEKWREVQVLFPNPVTLWNIARTYEEKDDLLAARATFEQYISLEGLSEKDIEDAEAKIAGLDHRMAGEKAAEKGNLTEAIAQIQKAHEHNPHPRNVLRVAEILERLERYGEAREHYERASAMPKLLERDRVRIESGLARIELRDEISAARLADDLEAELHARENLENIAPSIDNQVHIAELLEELDREKEAIAAWKVVRDSKAASTEQRRVATAHIDEIERVIDENEPEETGGTDGRVTQRPDGPGEPAQVDETTSRNGFLVGGWTLAGLAVAGTGSGIALFVTGNGTVDEIGAAIEENDKSRYDSLTSDLEGIEAGMISSFAVAGAAAIGAGILLYLAYDEPAEAGVAVSPDGVRIYGRF